MNLTNANININDNNPINLLDLNINLINKKSKTANNFYHSKNINEKSIISRNRLIKRQKQFLLDSKDEDNFESHKARKNYYAEILANQEKTLTKTTKDQLKKIIYIVYYFEKLINQKKIYLWKILIYIVLKMN